VAILRFSWLKVVAVLLLVVSMLTGCAVPQLKAEQRIFLPLSLEFVGDYRLPKQDFEGVTVGGLSGITYDRLHDRFYALSDDPGIYAPARFYTLKLNLTHGETTAISSLQIEGMTTLIAADGKPYAANTIDPEGIALSPQQSVYISSEGKPLAGIAPFIGEFDL